ESGGFAPEYEIMCFVCIAEIRIRMQLSPELCQKIINTFRLFKKLFSRIIISDIHMIPVIEPRPLQHFVICRKSQRADQMKGRVRSGTRSADVAGICRYFRLIEYNVICHVYSLLNSFLDA